MADVNHTAVSDIGSLDYATVERRIDKLWDQLNAARSIIGTVSDSIERMISGNGRTNGRPHDPIFALDAARDLLNEMEEGLDVNELLAPTNEEARS